jgi:chlorophyll synthase
VSAARFLWNEEHALDENAPVVQACEEIVIAISGAGPSMKFWNSSESMLMPNPLPERRREASSRIVNLRTRARSVGGEPRPILRIPWSLLVTARVAGWGQATTAAGIGLILHDAVTLRSTLLIAGVAVMYWLGFAINDYCDAPSDAPDEYKRRHNPFVGNHFNHRTMIGVVIALLASVLVLFVSFGLAGLGLYVLGSVAMWAYSAPPLRIKNRPGSDLLFPAVFGVVFPYLVPLILIRAPFSAGDGYLLAIGVLAGIAGQLRQQLRDFEIDSLSQVTFTTTFGVATASRLLCVIVAAISLWLLAALWTRTLPMTFVPLAAISVPILVECVLAPTRREMPMGLYKASSGIALCYLLILIGVSLRG